MSKKLLIVESPAKIKTISKFLGNDFKIMSTVGHIKDLPQRQLGVTLNENNPDAGIAIDYVVLEKKDKVISDLCKEASRANTIFLAPDPDREGEIIAWHVAQEVEKCTKKAAIYRITFNEITKSAVEHALAHPTHIDMAKVAAQQARRVLDRWVGYEVSPVLWRKIKKGLSAGRVQSVALRLICEREEAIRVFKPEEYWTIDGLFTTSAGSVAAALTQYNKKKIEPKNQQETETLVAQLPEHKYSITSIKDSQRSKNPAAPFMTSTLQQAAYNKLGFNVDKTMQCAQKLYEGVPLTDSNSPVALITYMRTDSLRIADTALKAARNYIENQYGQEYLPAKSLVYSKSRAQDAHESIRPIDVTITPDSIARYLSKELYLLYDLIWKRFVACQMKAALYAQRQVLLEGGPFLFKATGSTLLFDGFLRVYQEDQEEEPEKAGTEESGKKTTLPAGLEQNMAAKLETVTPKQHFTEPPPRYTQATLVKELEKEGIGRPSTYATIMKTIQAREYTELDTKKRFVPTELGMGVTKMLTENLPKIMNIKFTAHMEEKLDDIAQGTLERDRLLRNFYQQFSKDIAAFAGQQTKRVFEKLDKSCPTCKKGELVIRIGKTGAFVACDRYPQCTFTSQFKREEDGSVTLIAPEQQFLEELCPQCEKPLRRVRGRYGPFIACSGYPECTYIQQQKALFPCLSCAKELILRMWRGKSFWGCAGYPTCTFTLPGDIIQKACPQCDNIYLVSRTSAGEPVAMCPKPPCGYYIPLTELETLPESSTVLPKLTSTKRKTTTTKKSKKKESLDKTVSEAPADQVLDTTTNTTVHKKTRSKKSLK